MQKFLWISSFALLAVSATATTAVAAPWVRGFAINNYEPAFYYGGKLGSTDNPGSDCPKGTNPDSDYKAILKTKWRSDADVAELTKPVAPGHDPNGTISGGLTHRGFRKDIETYINPFAAPDPGMQQVTGKIAEGFNLDHAATGGFSSPDGEKGVDNAFYRAWGCLLSFRGTPYHAYMSQRSNDKMLDGLYTMVVRVSGNKDPMNDDNVTVEVAYSPDHLIKDPAGNIVRDYSFRAAKSEQYTRLKGKIRNGVVETEQVADLRIPAFSWAESNRGETDFLKGKLRLVINADGTASGLVGGYRDWRDLYGKDTFNVPSGGSTRETYTHQNQIAMYYALKRNADGFPDPKTGQNTAISAAFRFTATPAYVVDSAKPAPIDEPPGNFVNAEVPNMERALFIKATMTARIASPPHKNKTFDGGPARDEDGRAIVAPSQKGLEVNNAAPATVASAAH